MTAKEFYNLFKTIYRSHGDILTCGLAYRELPKNIRKDLEELFTQKEICSFCEHLILFADCPKCGRKASVI